VQRFTDSTDLIADGAALASRMRRDADAAKRARAQILLDALDAA
jgi:hypothetical protein